MLQASPEELRDTKVALGRAVTVSRGNSKIIPQRIFSQFSVQQNLKGVQG